MRAFVTGAAGFIGSTLVDRLLAEGHVVVGYGNFSTGQRAFVSGALTSPRFRLVESDLLDEKTLSASLRETDVVFHLAANADVRFGTDHPRRDLEQNTIATQNVLEAMRINSVGRIVFSSTGSVYGEAKVVPTPEDAPFPVQTSLYGASKLACEGLIAAYCEGFGFIGQVFRFVSILGERYTHGHIFDFCKQLRSDPARLRILGNGRQRKSYLYVQDCVSALMLAAKLPQRGYAVYNLGVDDSCIVDDSVGWICQRLGVQPERVYAGGDRGWIGDNPVIMLDTRKIRTLGWLPQVTIREAVERTVDYLARDAWILERRS